MGTRISQGGRVMLGFDVLFCFGCCCMQRCCYSLSLHLYVHILCMFCAYAAYVCCVWGKPTKGVRTLDSFRVNGL